MAPLNARDELMLLRARVEQLEKLHRPRSSNPRFPRRLRALAATGAFVALTPLALLAASSTFSDLNSAASEHRGNIQAIGDAGITTGFVDPNNPNARLYDPKAFVTREEMASFLARTAGLGGNAPVTNAATLQGYAAGDFARADIGVGPAVQSVPATVGPLGRLSFVAPRSGFVVVYATVVLNSSYASAGDAPYADTALSIREESNNYIKSPRTVRMGTGAGAIAITTVTLVETFGVGSGGTFSFALEGAAGSDRPVTALLPSFTAVFIPYVPATARP